jgi:SAM-dependent methyltransferase
MTLEQDPRLYTDLARWWSLFPRPRSTWRSGRSVAEVPHRHRVAARLLELDCGGGSLASHLKGHFELIFTDRSPAMLEVSRAVNPECEHIMTFKHLGEMDAEPA